MGQDLVEVHPGELRFQFELKKQSSCSVRLVNKSNDYVAFKVKTTSPKKYCVRPNTGVILPKDTCEFTVTMQAQESAPPDMQLKDKFLIQTTVVPHGTTENDLHPKYFSKEDGRLIEERKLKVVLISPQLNPKVQPYDETVDSKFDFVAPVLKDTRDFPMESTFTPKENAAFLEQSRPPKTFGSFKDTLTLIDGSPPKASLEDNSSEPQALSAASVPSKTSPPILKDSLASEGEFTKEENIHLSNVADDLEDLKAKLHNLQTKLDNAEKVITDLREDSKTTSQERHQLQQEMLLLRRKAAPRHQDGFPLLFVVYMALLGMAIGYLIHF